MWSPSVVQLACYYIQALLSTATPCTCNTGFLHDMSHCRQYRTKVSWRQSIRAEMFATDRLPCGIAYSEQVDFWFCHHGLYSHDGRLSEDCRTFVPSLLSWHNILRIGFELLQALFYRSLLETENSGRILVSKSFFYGNAYSFHAFSSCHM